MAKLINSTTKSNNKAHRNIMSFSSHLHRHPQLPAEWFQFMDSLFAVSNTTPCPCPYSVSVNRDKKKKKIVMSFSESEMEVARQLLQLNSNSHSNLVDDKKGNRAAAAAEEEKEIFEEEDDGYPKRRKKRFRLTDEIYELTQPIDVVHVRADKKMRHS